MLKKFLIILREWLMRFVGTFRHRPGDADLRQELDHHLELAEQDLRSRGYPPAEAARLARARHGQSEKVLEDLRTQRGIPWFGVFTLDVRLGLRMLRKNLGLTLIGGLALTIGFAILTNVFMYFDTIMWSNSVPLDDGEDVVAIQIWDPARARRSEIPLPDFEHWRDGMQSLELFGAFRSRLHEVTYPDGSIRQVNIAEMSASGFEVARISPALGRSFVTADERPEAGPVIVIAYDEWQRRFGGDPAVLGQVIRVGEVLRTVIGVMPEDFGFPINHRYWIPLPVDGSTLLPAPPAGAVFARLADGVPIETAQAELSSLGTVLEADTEQGSEPFRPTVMRYAQNFIDDTDPNDLARRNWNARLVILFVSLLLLPPCANIAMLIYARTVTRQEEIAIRTALGASRRRIVTQLCIEMLVLTSLAAILALGVASLAAAAIENRMLRRLENMPFWIDLGVSANTLLFAAGLAIVSALVIGWLPALQSTRHFAHPGLSALDPRNRIRLGMLWTVLVVAQIGFSFAALPTATEIAWGTLRTAVLDPGFAPEDFLTARLRMNVDREVHGDQQEARVQRFAQARAALIEALEREPGLTSPVTQTSLLAGQGGGRGVWHRVEVDDPEDAIKKAQDHVIEIGVTVVRRVGIDADYFKVMDSLLLAGRTFLSNEFAGSSRSVVINAGFAAEFFGDGNPVGRRVRYLNALQSSGSAPAADDPWYEIVGVTADRPAFAEGPTIFHPDGDGAATASYITFRTGPESGALRTRMTRLAADIDPVLAVEEVSTLAELYDDQAVGNYVGGYALIVGSLAVLLLSAAGLYALMSFTVNQRQREIGIRLALGARPRRLLTGIFGSALRQTAVGAGIGLLVALLIDFYIPAKQLGGWDVPGILPGAVVLMILTGVAAAYGPARRTLSVSPTDTLKQD